MDSNYIMYKHPEIDYQPQHPMLLEFEPSASWFGKSCTKKNFSEEATKAWYEYYKNNGQPKKYKKNTDKYNELKKQYGCTMTWEQAKHGLALLAARKLNKEAKEGFAKQEKERYGTEGLKPIHPLLVGKK